MNIIYYYLTTIIIDSNGFTIVTKLNDIGA